METLNFFTFLEEKLLEILFQVFFITFVVFLLVLYGSDIMFAVIPGMFFIIMQGIFQWCLYQRKRKISQHIIDLTDGRSGAEKAYEHFQREPAVLLAESEAGGSRL